MNKLGVFTTYECESPDTRLLAKVVVPHEGYKLKEGMEIVLGPLTSKIYYHPNNCYAYRMDTGAFRGRFAWSWFEIIGVFDSFDKLKNYLQTRSPEEDIPTVEPSTIEDPTLEKPDETSEVPTSTDSEGENKQEDDPFEEEQLSLF